MTDVRHDTSRRVLFVGEAVTLAHVARPIALVRKLVARGYRPVLRGGPPLCGALSSRRLGHGGDPIDPQRRLPARAGARQAGLRPGDPGALRRGRSRPAAGGQAGGGHRRLPDFPRGERTACRRALHQRHQRLLEPLRPAALACADDAVVAPCARGSRRQGVPVRPAARLPAACAADASLWREDTACPLRAWSSATSTPTGT